MLNNYNLNGWELVIGLEVHAQIVSNSKLFSRSVVDSSSLPNENVSLIDAAMPGMLPVLNEFCVLQAIKTGIALNATVNKYSRFDRKNYFYPDLPQGYQISQFYYPIVQNGHLDITSDDKTSKIVRINRLHLEQDAGKSIHDDDSDYTFIDLNRCGVGLMEIVTEPDLCSPDEAAEYLKKLRSILRYIGTCDGDMEKGNFRCDANVSVRKPGAPLGTRCEIKNLNSIKNVMKAIEYEASRQITILESGKSVTQETRLFDAETVTTRTMRSKEDAHDYRYFPDPDLLPLILEEDLIQKIGSSMQELPDAKVHRYVNTLNLAKYDASVIVADLEVAKYFEVAIAFGNPKTIGNWITTELFSKLNKSGQTIEECKIQPENLGTLIQLIENGTISGKIAKHVFEIMFESGESPSRIIKEHGLVQVSDTDILETVIDQVLNEHESSVKDYHSGKEKLFGFFVGQVMKKTAGKANPTLVNQLIHKKLEYAKQYSK